MKHLDEMKQKLEQMPRTEENVHAHIFLKGKIEGFQAAVEVLSEFDEGKYTVFGPDMFEAFMEDKFLMAEAAPSWIEQFTKAFKTGIVNGRAESEARIGDLESRIECIAALNDSKSEKITALEKQNAHIKERIKEVVKYCFLHNNAAFASTVAGFFVDHGGTEALNELQKSEYEGAKE